MTNDTITLTLNKQEVIALLTTIGINQYMNDPSITPFEPLLQHFEKLCDKFGDEYTMHKFADLTTNCIKSMITQIQPIM